MIEIIRKYSLDRSKKLLVDSSMVKTTLTQLQREWLLFIVYMDQWRNREHFGSSYKVRLWAPKLDLTKGKYLAAVRLSDPYNPDPPVMRGLQRCTNANGTDISRKIRLCHKS
ncbi:hypothetical protein TNCV_1664551 [Trichonephila clavipes]|uniref:Uncharacterized protein n=1 Tax=Trichonephila clavipes TaxID=2585209 RepID=A0A8X6RTP9_TRICX|nr:hypothetical protein TNCV_1664551 [Trichonephila clavipes]